MKNGSKEPMDGHPPRRLHAGKESVIARVGGSQRPAKGEQRSPTGTEVVAHRVAGRFKLTPEATAGEVWTRTAALQRRAAEMRRMAERIARIVR